MYPDENSIKLLSKFKEECENVNVEDIVRLLDQVKGNLPGRHDYTILHSLYKYTMIPSFTRFFKRNVAIMRNRTIEHILYDFLSRYLFVVRKGQSLFVSGGVSTLKRIKKVYLDGVVSFECPLCSSRFSYWRSFILHYKTIHKVEYRMHGDISNLCNEKVKMVKREFNRLRLRTKGYDIQTLLVYLKMRNGTSSSMV